MRSNRIVADRNSLLDAQDWEVLWGTHTGNVPHPWMGEPWIGVDKEGVIELDGRFHIRHLMTILQSVGRVLNPPFLYGDPVFRAKGRMIVDRGGNEICTTNSSDLAEFIARTMSIGRFIETSHPEVQECKLQFKHEDIAAVLAQVGCYSPSIVTAVEELVVAILVSFNGELKAILSNLGRDAIHVREGGGPEDFVASLALSLTKLQMRAADRDARQEELNRLYAAALSPSRFSYDSLRWWHEFPYVDGMYLAMNSGVDTLVTVEGECLFFASSGNKEVDWRKEFVGAKFFGPIPQDPPQDQS